MTENLTPPTVGQMVRMTAENTAQFMAQVADHIDQLEAKVAELTARVAELESASNVSN